MSMQQHLKSGPIPLYHQLKLVLLGEIERGEYKAGDRLPSEPELIRHYGISRITVRQALNDLEVEGRIVRRHGKGTYVAEAPIEQELVRLTDFVEDMQQAGLFASSQVVSFVEEPGSPVVVEALKLPGGSDVVRIDRLRLADGKPIAYDITRLSLRFGKLLAEDELANNTIYHILESRYRIPVETGKFYITSSNATTQQATLLDVSPGASLLVIQRITYTTGEVPVYIQDRYYRTDRVRYQVKLQRHHNTAGDASGSTISEFRPIFDE